METSIENVESTAPTKAAGYDKIARLTECLQRMPNLEVELKHHFAKGVYAREGFIPKGTVFTGRVHKQSQINIISKGDVSVLTEKGLIRMAAPCTLVSPPGAQRAAYAHEDTVWTTILGTEKTDPDEIYETLTAATFEDYQLACQEILKLTEKEPCLSQPQQL